MSKSPITTLEAALLASESEPEFSPRKEFEFRGHKVAVVFRHLSQTRLDRLALTAQQELEEERRRRELKDEPWRDAEAILDRWHKNRWDLLQLHAAMRDADHPKREAAPLQLLERHLDPDTHAFLAEAYEQWKAGLSLAGVTPEDIKAFREAVKKTRRGGRWTRSCFGCSSDSRFRSPLPSLRF